MPKLSTYTTGTPTADDYIPFINDPGGTPTNLNTTPASLLGANLTAVQGLTTANNLITKWTGAGTAATVDLTTDWLTQYVAVGGRGISQTIIGGSSSGNGTVVIQGDVASNVSGAINLRSPVRLRDVANETLTAEAAPLLRIRQTRTLNFASASFGGGTVAGLPGAIDFGPIVKFQQSAATFGSRMVTNNAGYFNVSSVAANFGILASFESRWTAYGDTQSITLGPIADFFSGPFLSIANGGTLTGGVDFVNFEGTLLVNTGVTLPLYRPFVAKRPTVTGTGTITAYQGVTVENLLSGDAVSASGFVVGVLQTTGTNVGIDVAKPSGGTTNIGIRNAGPHVDTPEAKTITVVGDTISHGARVVEVNNTSGSSKTLTSAPTISDGVNGEVLEIVNVGTSDVVVQDQGTLASSNLRLGATTRTLSTRDVLILRYSSAIGDWREIGFTNVL